MENDLPHFLSELLTFTDKRIEGKTAMNIRFPVFMKHLLHFLEPMQIVKVTGTNGKGSLCALLESCLMYEGLKVGLFTSPHLSRITERFRVNSIETSPDVLDYYAEKVLHIAYEVVETYGESFKPSFFEALILIAIYLFYEQKVDVIIFEAGIGGYNDAISLLPGKFSAITSIGMDHKDQLGDSLESIAANKAGIASNNSFLILGADISPSLCKIIEDDVNAREVIVYQASIDDVKVTFIELRLPMQVELTIDKDLIRCELPLLGHHQLLNFSTLVRLVQILAEHGVVRDFNCLKGVKNVKWAGRLEVRDIPPCFIIDAAHNEHGILALINSLADLAPYPERILIYGASADKDYQSCLPHLSEIAPQVYLVEGFYRAEKANIIASMLPTSCRGVKSFSSPAQAFAFFAKNTSFNDKFIIATVSIFMIGELLSCMDSMQSSSQIN